MTGLLGYGGAISERVYRPEIPHSISGVVTWAGSGLPRIIEFTEYDTFRLTPMIHVTRVVGTYWSGCHALNTSRTAPRRGGSIAGVGAQCFPTMVGVPTASVRHCEHIARKYRLCWRAPLGKASPWANMPIGTMGVWRIARPQSLREGASNLGTTPPSASVSSSRCRRHTGVAASMLVRVVRETWTPQGGRYRGSLGIGGRNAIDDFRKFNAACLSKGALTDNVSAETFG
jgi:hypothetical protein